MVYRATLIVILNLYANTNLSAQQPGMKLDRKNLIIGRWVQNFYEEGIEDTYNLDKDKDAIIFFQDGMYKWNRPYDRSNGKWDLSSDQMKDIITTKDLYPGNEKKWELPIKYLDSKQLDLNFYQPDGPNIYVHYKKEMTTN